MPNKTSLVELRIPHDGGLIVWKELLEAREERVAIALVGGATLSDGYALLVNKVTPLPPSAYRGSVHGTSWRASFNAQAIEDAHRLRLGLLILHSHGNQSPPRLSSTDVKSGTELCTAFRIALPTSPSGTAVFGAKGSVGGLGFVPGESDPIPISRVKWISDPIRSLPPKPAKKETGTGMFSRQKILIGEEGQRLLANSNVGVIGLGGGGSHVVQQLALLGIGQITIVDDDVLDETNRHRVVGARPSDVEKKLTKVEIMRRLVGESNPQVRVASVTERFPSQGSTGKLKECDVLVGCLDTLHARNELQTFAWRYLIPYVDIGLTIQLSEGSSYEPRIAKRISGQVYDLIPGMACLRCAQLITDSRLTEESDGRDPSYMTSPQRAQVVGFNGVLASQAVNEVLQLITGYAVRTSVPNALQFDGIKGTLSPCLLERKSDCKTCTQELGHGDPTW